MLSTEHETASEGPRSNRYAIPIAIVVAGLAIAGTILYTNMNVGGTKSLPASAVSGTQTRSNVPVIRPVTTDDHLRGNPNAKIFIVEYSDFECPYCGMFHGTMKQLVNEYGDSGPIAWVYRHFPIKELHKQAWPAAIAAECAAEQGGSDAFWKYADLLFENNNGGNDGIDLALLPEFATRIGLNREAFNACIGSERTRGAVEEDYNEAIGGAMGEGTPHNIIIVGGQTVALPGYIPLEDMRAIIKEILAQIR